MAVLAAGGSGFGQVPGPSINMVSGTQWPGGDPFLQRQNEPSMAVSSRNNLHLLAGANDYRTVDLPGVPGSEPTGDAWLGLFKSIDGGQTWQSTLIPGFPQDASAQGMSSPLKGYSAGADPVVRAGTNGLFYYSGIVFNRTTNASKVFVARFSDDNNFEGADTMRYLDTSIVATGNGTGTFEDKPFIAVDIPRANRSQDDDEGGAPATCSIPATATTPAQSFPAGRIYMVWTEFTGPKANNHAAILFSRSTNCGTHWSEPKRISGGQFTNQGAAISIDPRNGAIYVAWRVFAHDKEGDAIYFTASFNGGQDFMPPIAVAAINPFDQGTTAVSFRTNAFPAMAVDGNGRIYISWAQRGMGPNGDSRVVVSSLQPPVANSDGEVDDDVWKKVVWPAAVPADANAARGHQFMPAMAFSSGKLSLAWYDLRFDDEIRVFTPTGGGQYSSTLAAIGAIVFGTYIQDPASPAPQGSARHTLDVRLAQAPPGYPLAFGQSVQVSQYAFGTPAASTVIQQLELNTPNLPMFQLGTVPFFGDYIDVAGPTFIPVTGGGWRYNTLPTDPDNTRVVWTDNRNVVQPADGNWANYTPVGLPGSTSTFDSTQMRPGCLVGQAGMRNQDIFTAAVTPGIAVSAKSNSKQLSTTLQRAFPVTVQNTTTLLKTYRLTIQQQPTGGKASFLQFPVTGLPDPLTSIDLQISPLSTAAKTVFATSTDPHAAIPVSVTEIANIGGPLVSNGQQSSVTLNQDVSNPNIANPNIANLEVYNPNIANPNIANPNIANPNIANPNIANPNIANPNIANTVVANPNIANPNIANPNIANPNIANPNIANPNIANPNIANTALTDVSWAITNTGNTAASYSLKLLQSQAPPAGVVAQVIISKQYQNPVPNGCSLAVQNNYYPLGNIATPTVTDPSQLNSPTATDPYSPTVAILPGETILVTVRAYDTTTSSSSTALAHYNPAVSLTPVVVSHGANTGTTTPPASLAILTLSIPSVQAGIPYPSTTINATGGTGPYTWAIASGSAGGLALNPTTGVLTGTPGTAGTFTFVVTATDQKNAVASRQLSFNVTAPPTIVATTAPAGEVSVPYSLQFSKTGGTAPFTWSVTGTLPTGLSIDPASGLLSGTPQASGAFSVSIQLKDSLGAVATALPITLNISAAPAIVATTAPAGEVSVPYSLQFAKTGGIAPFTWSVTGTLPTGLSIDPVAGLLSGTPQASGAFNVSIQLKDSLGAVATALPITLNITAAPAIVATTAPAGEVSIPYSLQFTKTGGTGPFTWSVAGTLPTGLSIDPVAGLLSGTPQASGSFNVSIQLMDNLGATATPLPVIINVNAAPAIVATTAPAGEVSVAYSQQFTKTGGTAPFTWSVTGTLPTGLSIDPASGLLGGSPQASGAFNVSIQLKDSLGAVATALPVTINISAAPAIGATTAPAGEVSIPYSVQFTKTGGTAPFTWSVTGTLPTGLSIDPASGLLSGTPQASGAFNVSIQLKDSLGATATPLPITLNISATPAIVATTAPVGEAGIPYALQFTKTGGTAPFTWSVLGTLPTGVTINSATGLLSGLPQTAGSFSVNIQLKDALGATATPLPVTIAINPTLAITSLAPPTGYTGANYSYALTANGGVGSYTFSISGTPPPGLVFTGTGLTNAPNTAGSYPITINVMDSLGATASANYTIVVNPYLALTYTGSQTNPAGTFQINPTPAPPTNFTYALDLRNISTTGVADANWTFQTISPSTGLATINYTYSGFHAFYQVVAYLKAFSGTNTPITVYQAGPVDCCTSPSSGFTVTGSFTIPVVAGQPFGFIVGGSNFDTNAQLNGTLTINGIGITVSY